MNMMMMMNSGNQTKLSSTSVADYAGLLGWVVSQIQIVEIVLAISIFVTINSLRLARVHGLPVWPVVGMLPSLVLALRGDIYEWITSVLARKSGTFTFRGPWLTNLHCVITTDPRNLEYLLKNRFANFPKGPYFGAAVRDLLGDGIFAADGATWRHQRRVASLEFHSPGFRAVAARSLRELVHKRLLPTLADAHARRGSFDLQDVLLRLTFDHVCLIALGADPGCLRPGLPDVPFARAFETATEATTARFVTPTAVWRAMRWLGLGSERRLRNCIERVDEFAYGIIQAKKKEPKDRTVSDLLTVFMSQGKRNKKVEEEEEEEYSDKLLRDICVNFILAARDTSSVALTWFFWLLDQHPKVENRILDELRQIVAASGGEGGGDMIFDVEQVRQMEYLHAALSEALRLYPPVPVDHKEVIEDDVFPDGTSVKKGTKVIYAIYAMGRTDSIWGDDCREYRPERWLRDGRNFVSEPAYKFAAFNGARLCLGKELAYQQMKFVAASVLWRYMVKVAATQTVVPKLGLTLYMKHGLKVTLAPRHEDEANQSQCILLSISIKVATEVK